MKKYLLLPVILLFSSWILAQQYEVVNGKKMIAHEVVKGNTLFSIAKQYNVNMSDILNANPEAEKGIKLGQKLYIPLPETKEVVQPKTPEKQVRNDNPFEGSLRLNKYHIVTKSETLYSISKEYGVNTYDIIKLNPGIENGILIGQKIIIPDADNQSPNSNSVDIIYYDTVIKHKVLKSETLYSISKRYMVTQKAIASYNGLKDNNLQPNDTLLIPLEKENFEDVKTRKVPDIKENIVVKAPTNEFVYKQKDRYKVVLALPLGLSNPSERYARIATEFYMGAAYALDSLQKKGLNADVFVIDCSVDSSTFMKQLNAHQDADLIIGPFLGARYTNASKFSLTHKITMINPISGSEKNLEGNPYLINAMTSDLTLMEGMATYLSKSSEQKKIILVKPLDKDMALYNSFRNRLMKEAQQTRTKFIECSINDVPTYFSKGVDVAVVFPTRNENEASKLVNLLYKNMSKVGNASIEIYGTKEWTSMERIKDYYKNVFHLHFGMANDFDYTYPSTISLLKGIRNKYNTDLTKFIAQGFDVIYYFMSKNFLHKIPEKLVMNDFHLEQEGAGNGFVNTSSYIYEQRDFDYILLEQFK